MVFARLNPFKRTLGENYLYDYIIGKTDKTGKTIDMEKNACTTPITGLHESLVHLIASFASTSDVVRLKMTNKLFDGMLTSNDVFEKNIQQEGILDTFIKSVFCEKCDLLKYVLEKGVCDGLLNRAIVYSVTAGKNDVAKILIGNKTFGVPKSEVNEHAYCVPPLCTPSCDACCYEYISSGCDVDFTTHSLLESACRVDNLEIAQYVMKQFNVSWTYENVKTCIFNMSFDVLEFLVKKRGACLSKTLVAWIIKYTADTPSDSAREFLEKIFKANMASLTPYYVPTILHASQYMYFDSTFMIKFIDKYASDRAKTVLFRKACIRNPDFLYDLLNKSSDFRLTDDDMNYYQKKTKNMKIMNPTKIRLSTNFKNLALQTELMIINNIEMQKRV